MICRIYGKNALELMIDFGMHPIVLLKRSDDEYIKYLFTGGGLFLLQLRDNDPSISYPNTWSFFGGGVDNEESKDNALYRELEEELEWQPEKIECLYESKNEKLNCKITYYLVYCDVPSDKLILGEGQAMWWAGFLMRRYWPCQTLRVRLKASSIRLHVI